jgi:hypothetical protein
MLWILILLAQMTPLDRVPHPKQEPPPVTVAALILYRTALGDGDEWPDARGE